MGVFIQIMQLLASLSILVLFHEFGHFAFAKLFKTRVEKFYLFFNPWFSLFKFKKGETEYGIGWLPLGGYVKISGMIDESMDREQMAQEPKPWEFRSKPAWQRLLIMLGGVMVNFILAALIYIMLLFVWGEDYIPTKNITYGINPDPIGREIGFQPGDKIVSVNGEEVEKFKTIISKVLLDNVEFIEVKRNNNIYKIQIGDTTFITDKKNLNQLESTLPSFARNLIKIIEEKDNFIIEKIKIGEDNKNLIIKEKSKLYNLRFPFIAAEIVKGANAEKAGLKANDKFIAANGRKMQYFDEYTVFFKNHKNKDVDITILRRNDTIHKKVKVNENGVIGVKLDPTSLFQSKHLDYNFVESVPAGINLGITQVSEYLKQFKLIFNPKTEAYKQVGSFVTITKLFPQEWDWQNFWALTAFLSIILGVVNVLPIPALDGGHAMFVLFEMVSGRKPSEKFLEYAQITGFLILIGIMIFAIKNDIVNNFF